MQYEYLCLFQLQMAALLAMSGGQADRNQVERLQTQLAQARSEIHVLTSKVQECSQPKVRTYIIIAYV